MDKIPHSGPLHVDAFKKNSRTDSSAAIWSALSETGTLSSLSEISPSEGISDTGLLVSSVESQRVAVQHFQVPFYGDQVHFHLKSSYNNNN